MPRLTLNLEALAVESFSAATAAAPSFRPTTTMNTHEPGCTTPELCGGTVFA